MFEEKIVVEAPPVITVTEPGAVTAKSRIISGPTSVLGRGPDLRWCSGEFP